MLLALRVLTPTGFMPAFERGAITIVVCPDASTDSPSGMMHHSGDAKHHEQCPFASGSSFGTVGGEFVALLGPLVFVAVLLLGRTSDYIERHSRQLRPPLRGPPVTA